MNKFLERFNELRNGTPIEELALKIGGISKSERKKRAFLKNTLFF